MNFTIAGFYNWLYQLRYLKTLFCRSYLSMARISVIVSPRLSMEFLWRYSVTPVPITFSSRFNEQFKPVCSDRRLTVDKLSKDLLTHRINWTNWTRDSIIKLHETFRIVKWWYDKQENGNYTLICSRKCLCKKATDIHLTLTGLWSLTNEDALFELKSTLKFCIDDTSQCSKSTVRWAIFRTSDCFSLWLWWEEMWWRYY